MSDFDPDEMGPLMTAIVLLIGGFAGLFFGAIAFLIFWPAGLIVLGIGALMLLAAPVVGFLAWRNDNDSASDPDASL